MSTRGLAIHSDLGKQSLERETEAVAFLEEFFAQSIARTRTGQAVLDGIMHHNGVVTGVIEIKSRSLSLPELEKFKTGLVTEAKLAEGRSVSATLQAPFFLVFLLKDNWMVIWEMSDKRGNKTFDYEVVRTRTKKTVEGGSAMRPNGFLPVTEAKILVNIDTKEVIEL
jgi:hypothetical protein